MKYLLFICSILSLSACQIQTESESKLSYSTESVFLAFDIATKIQNNQVVKEAEWENLFLSQGYEAYFCAFEKEESVSLLKQAFEFVFDKSKVKDLDSILQKPIALDASSRFTYLLLNLNSFKKNQEAIEQFISNTDFLIILEKANHLAQTYLPDEHKEGDVQLHKVNFILMEPNAYVTDCGLILDVQNAFDMGEEELIKTIAHEFHHNYRNKNISLADHVLINNINDLQQEGIADLIDKATPPIKEMGIYPQSVVEAYNDMFENSPHIFSKLDSLTKALLSGDLQNSTYEALTERYFLDGGHANGFYMSLKIKEAGLLDELVKTYNKPIDFIKLYNEAVAKSESEYSFSKTFISYAKELQRKHLADLANRSDEKYSVTFVVEVPREEDEVFIVGNKPELGEWQADKVKLAEGDSSMKRQISLKINSPAEFKFTRGSWKTEGRMENDTKGKNIKLDFNTDTLVMYKISSWLDLEN